jgi:septal ring factor EnvC (AmiA/AmiB activator)
VKPDTRSGFALTLLLLCMLADTAHAQDDVSDQSEIRERMEQTRQKHEALLGVREQLNHQLSELEMQQAQLATKVSDLERQAQQRERRIRDLKNQRDGLKKEIETQQRQLAGQLRAAHVIGSKDWLKLLLNQEDASHLARVLAYYGYLSQARSDQIHHLEEAIARLESLERELNDEATLKAEIKRQSQQEKTALAEASKARKELLKGWDRELKDQATQLREDQQSLGILVDSFAGESWVTSSEADSPGHVKSEGSTASRCPPQGVISARFGSPRMTSKWDGVLISGKEGAPVKAVSAGKIAFADWFRGYGLLTIVDHGNGVMSLYAFNQTLAKSKGDAVASGDVIATMGATGGREKPGLYFGVRSQGKPIDPLIWCKQAQ